MFSRRRCHCRKLYFLSPDSRDITLDQVFVAIIVKDASRSIVVERFHSLHDVVKTHAVMHHSFGREQNLVFLDVTAYHRHLRNAFKRKQARSYDPVGNRPELHH